MVSDARSLSLLSLLPFLYRADALLFAANCSCRSLRFLFHVIYLVHASGVTV